LPKKPWQRPLGLPLSFLERNILMTVPKTLMQQKEHAAVKSILPQDAAERKLIPLCTGVFDYFPDALAEIARVSHIGNQQHNPGQPLHWARSKSADFADTIARHLLERGTRDVDGARHSAKLAWRALANLQIEIEEQEGKPISRGSKA
jgi:Domain of unknown function (DUF5664)